MDQIQGVHYDNRTQPPVERNKSQVFGSESNRIQDWPIVVFNAEETNTDTDPKWLRSKLKEVGQTAKKMLKLTSDK